MTNFNVANATLIVAVLLPALTGIVTKSNASASLKGLAHILLTVTAAAVQVVINAGGHVILSDWIRTTVVTYVIGIASYHGYLQKADWFGKVKVWTSDFGVGPSTPVVPDFPVPQDPAFPSMPEAA